VPSVRPEPLARGLGQLVLDGLGPEEREEATLRCFTSLEKGQKRWRVRSFATPFAAGPGTTRTGSLAQPDVVTQLITTSAALPMKRASRGGGQTGRAILALRRLKRSTA